MTERAVQSFKVGMKKLTTGSLEARVARFLFTYRITPQMTTGTPPSELLLGHRLRCHLDFIRPNLETKVHQSQCCQKQTHDFHAKECNLQVGDHVLAKNFSPGEPWLHGSIHSKTGPVSFTVELNDGRIVNQHLDQLREDSAASNATAPSSVTNNDDVSSQMSDNQLPTDDSSTELRRSKCDRHPPPRFDIE